MKEANPVSLRFGISVMWPSITNMPIFYSEQYRLIRLLNYLLFKIIGGNIFYYTVFRPTIIKTKFGRYILHFYYFPTQLTFRGFIGKRRSLYLKQLAAASSFVQIQSLYPSSTVGQKNYVVFKLPFYRSRLKGRKRIISINTDRVFNLPILSVLPFNRNNKSLFNKRLKCALIGSRGYSYGSISRLSYKYKKLQSRRQMVTIFKKKRKIFFSKCKYKVQSLMRSISQIRLRALFSRAFIRCLNADIRVFIAPVVSLFVKSYPKLLRYVYILHHKFFYYHNTVNFLDTVFIATVALQFRDPQVLVSFICREIERTRKHFKFLSMLRQIVAFFYQSTVVMDGNTGFRLLLRGPVNGHSRTKRIKFEFRPAPKKTVFTKPLFFANFYSNTIFGTVGVRLWLG